MAIISPYSSTFSNTYNEIKDLYSQGELQSKEERNDFIKSKGLNPDDFRNTENDDNPFLPKEKK